MDDLLSRELATQLRDLDRSVKASSVLALPSMNETFLALCNSTPVPIEMVDEISFEQAADVAPTIKGNANSTLIDFEVKVGVTVRKVTLTNLSHFYVTDGGVYSFRAWEKQQDPTGKKSTQYKICVDHKNEAQYEVLEQSQS